MFSTDRTKAIKEFVSFHDTLETEDYSYSREVKRAKEEIRQEFLSLLLGGVEPGSLVGLPRLERDAILTSLRKQGFSIWQMERLTGVSRGIIAKCMAKGL
ncbi:MAG: hypothetical protein FWE41_04585 [Coriobacteriia bacterium]|nr:hypothetical protein [Coriobacteriia bacterium]MCL2750767.1 hypothetical protein [Coriobacteriia bacterium]